MISEPIELFISAKVAAGRYNSASEVVREALRLLEEHDQNRAARLGGFNQELERRLEALDSGKHIEPAESCDRLKHKSEQRRKSKALSRNLRACF